MNHLFNNEYLENAFSIGMNYFSFRSLVHGVVNQSRELRGINVS